MDTISQWLESILIQALNVPNGDIIATILGACGIAVMALIILALWYDDGRIEHPMPDGWELPKRAEE